MKGVGGVVLVVSLASFVAPCRGAGQEVTLSAGPASYDLSGTGTGFAASARYGHPLSSWLSVEAGVSVLAVPQRGSDDAARLLQPEVGLTLGLPVGRTALLFMVGGGYGADVESMAHGDPTLFVALGLDVPAKGRVGFRPSMRMRIVDPWVGTVMEYNLGVRVALGS